MQLTGPRDQLSRISSRLKQLGGLASLDLAWEVLAYSYVGVAAALEAAFSQAADDAIQKLRARSFSELNPTQLAAVAESSFVAFYDAERSRRRFDPRKAMAMRELLIQELRGAGSRSPRSSVLESTGIPGREHFRLFFQVATGGVDPRGPNQNAPLARLVGRLNEVGGPRNVFAHECAEPSQYEFLAGQGTDWGALATAVAALENVIADLHELLDALEAACTNL